MNKKNAAAILERQKSKIQSINNENCYLWKTQTSSFVRTFFGESSTEYSYINDFNFHDSLGGYVNPEANSRILNQFIDDCIITINLKGLVKREWKHVLITTNPSAFWAIFIAIISFAFWMGTLVGNTSHKSNNTSNENANNKNDSIHSVDFSNKNKSTNKTSDKPDTTLK